MGLDMSLYKFPKTEYSVSTILAVNAFINEAGNDIKRMFKYWYDEFGEYVPSTKIIAELMDICPDCNFIEEVGYWRKANAIHKWFVDNVQDGLDDCGFHRPVTREDLETLKRLCKQVLDDHSKAEKLLQSMPGFFFGVYDYDDGYFLTIQKTYDLCSKLLEEFDFENYNIYYASSW